MDLHLRGKSVLITGASKGIGAATAEAFAEEGSNVHLAARSTEAMQALAERLRAAHMWLRRCHLVSLRWICPRLALRGRATRPCAVKARCTRGFGCRPIFVNILSFRQHTKSEAGLGG
jgi:NAD(P)-dependent dehydrogenase (short-subunit alcohol dehydrogenase family)